MEVIIFLGVYLVSVLCIWIYVHNIYKEKPYKEEQITKEEKVMWVVFNLVPFLNTLICIVLLVGNFLMYCNATVVRVKKRLKWDKGFNKFYKL